MELKNKLIDKIKNLKDEDLVTEIYDWVEALTAESNDDEFSEEEINAVAEGFQDYKKGKLISEEQAKELFQQWLTSKEK
jgi:predicted transcriptional regulator